MLLLVDDTEINILQEALYGKELQWRGESSFSNQTVKMDLDIVAKVTSEQKVEKNIHYADTLFQSRNYSKTDEML